ncbi:MAG: hypothetical protein KBC26_01960 [Candidatus Pacebacteria bacterium]|nr:hypothetical protein [Candidatus Paceibacterota bacterium]
MKVKVIGALFLLCVLSALVFGITDVKAVGTGVPVNDFEHQMVTTKQTVQDQVIDRKNDKWKMVRDLMVRRIVDLMTEEIINWINGGGKPKFVGDWKAFLNDAGNIAFDSLNEYLKTEGLNLCAPFSQQLRVRLIAMYKYYNVRGNNMPVTCRFEDFRQNLENTKDFLRRGDWLTYDAMFSPEVNPYWISLRLEGQFLTKASAEKEARQNESTSAGGFLAPKKCLKYTNDDQSKECEKWNIMAPASVVANAANKIVDGKFDFTSNIQSIYAAVINALIDRLVSYFQDGFSSTGSGDSGDGDEIIAQYNQEQVDNMIAEYQQFIDYFDPVAQKYNEALTLAQSLAQCATSGVGEATVTEIQAVIDGIQTALTKAMENLQGLQGVDVRSSDFSEQLIGLQQLMDTFRSMYAGLIQLMESDNAEMGNNTALQEAQAKLDELLTIKSEHPECVQ